MFRTETDITTDINAAKEDIAMLKGSINDCDTELQNIEDNIEKLKKQKDILEKSYIVVSDLKDYLVGDTGEMGVIGSLDESSVCIQEIKSDVSVQIFNRCKNALTCAETVIMKLEMDIKNAEEKYDVYYDRKINAKNKLINCQSNLESLNNELFESQNAEE